MPAYTNLNVYTYLLWVASLQATRTTQISQCDHCQVTISWTAYILAIKRFFIYKIGQLSSLSKELLRTCKILVVLNYVKNQKLEVMSNDLKC